MPMLAPFNPPSAEVRDDIMLVYDAIRRFDHNHGASFRLPVVDPHGRRLSELTMDELHEVATWCMLPEFHEAVSREFWVRRLRRDGANQYYAPIGPCRDGHQGYDDWHVLTYECCERWLEPAIEDGRG